MEGGVSRAGFKERGVWEGDSLRSWRDMKESQSERP